MQQTLCQPDILQVAMKFTVAALYRFTTVNRPEALRAPLALICSENECRGTLLLAPEGINGTIAGPDEGIQAVITWIRANIDGCEGLDVKFSYADHNPFLRMKVRLKKEIVTMGVPDIDPTHTVGTYVAPEEWNALISDPDVMVIDTRNDYEVGIGTFKGAINPETETFRSFPAWADENLPSPDKADGAKPRIAMFCTGGIRCEKSTAYLKSRGFENVYHLQGGILKYLETVPEDDSLWGGECFVFDQRVAVGHGLAQGTYDQCFACRYPITDEDKTSPLYSPGVSCPRCHESTDAATKRRFAERQKQMALAARDGRRHLGSANQETHAPDTSHDDSAEQAAEIKEKK